MGEAFRAARMHPSVDPYKAADSVLPLEAARHTSQFFDWMPKTPPRKYQISDSDVQYPKELARLTLRIVNMRELLHQVQNQVDTGKAPEELIPLLHKSSLAANKDLLKLATCQLGAVIQI